jgi:hypothetical protein
MSKQKEGKKPSDKSSPAKTPKEKKAAKALKKREKNSPSKLAE